MKKYLFFILITLLSVSTSGRKAIYNRTYFTHGGCDTVAIVQTPCTLYISNPCTLTTARDTIPWYYSVMFTNTSYIRGHIQDTMFFDGKVIAGYTHIFREDTIEPDTGFTSSTVPYSSFRFTDTNSRQTVFYPQWWGSVGDGVSYDRLPIQFALEAASKKTGYGKGLVEFCGCSERRYNISNVLYIFKNTTLDMNFNTLYISRANRQMIILPSGDTNVEIKHCRFEGIGHYDDIGIGRSAIAFNPAGTLPGVWNCQIDSNYFDGSISTCVAGGNRVSHCKFYHNTSYTDSGESGWYFNSGFNDTFVDNIVIGPGQGGIAAVGGARGFYFKYNDSTYVRRNTITGWPGYAVCFPDYRSRYVFVDSNIVEGSDKYGSIGIALLTVDTATVNFNRVSKCNFYGIYLKSSNTQCFNNYIDSTLLYRGIETAPPTPYDLVGDTLTNDYQLITGNRLVDNYGGGIRIYQPGVGTEISFDTVLNASTISGAGIQVQVQNSSTIVHDDTVQGYLYKYYVDSTNVTQYYNNK